MKKRFIFLFSSIFMTALLFVSCEKQVNDVYPQDVSPEFKASPCVTIPSGMIYNSQGDVITTGYDQWGYNYQAHSFNGFYCDSYQNAAWCQPNVNDKLKMKWNEAWLSNKDCDGDGLLDRHYGYDSYIGSGAWLTNHMSGTYMVDGVECKWNYFVKIIAAPADATIIDGAWYNANGIEIGPVIWGQFAIIQEVSNDPCNGEHGSIYNSPDHSGLGNW